MQVLSTLHSVLSKLHGVPTIRITWDICVAAVVKKGGTCLIYFLYSDKWERFVFLALLIGALGGFFIRESRVILKKEIDLKQIRKDLAKIRKSRTIDNTQIGTSAGSVDDNGSELKTESPSRDPLKSQSENTK